MKSVIKMKKIITVIILASISAYTYAVTGIPIGTQFSEEAAHIATPFIPTINEEISVYKSNDKDIYFYQPQFNIKKKDIKNAFLDSQVDLQKNNKDTNIEISIEFPIYLYSQDIENDIVYSLNNNIRLSQERSKGPNGITKISPSDVSVTPYNLLIIYALIDGKKIPVYANPRLEDIEGGIPISTQENTKYKVDANLTGTLSDIKSFIESPRFIGEVYYMNINTDKVAVTANINNIFKSNSFNKLFGDESENKENIVRSSSNGEGWGLNLGFVKFGKIGNNNTIETLDKHKRWISKNLLSDMLEDYFLGIDFRSYCSEASKDCHQIRNTVLNQLLSKVIDNSSKVTAEFRHVKGNQYTLVNELTKEALGAVNIGEEVMSRPSTNLDASENKTVSVAKDVGAKIDSTLNLTNKDEIKWTKKGGKWVPTKIDLYLINKSGLSNSSNFDFTQILAKSKSMQRLMLTPISLKQPIAIPDVTGLMLDEAKLKIKNLYRNVNIVIRKTQTNKAKNSVISQMPTAGIKHGSSQKLDIVLEIAVPLPPSKKVEVQITKLTILRTDDDDEDVHMKLSVDGLNGRAIDPKLNRDLGKQYVYPLSREGKYRSIFFAGERTGRFEADKVRINFWIKSAEGKGDGLNWGGDHYHVKNVTSLNMGVNRFRERKRSSTNPRSQGEYEIEYVIIRK